MKNIFSVLWIALLSIASVASAVNVTTSVSNFTAANGTGLDTYTPDFGGPWGLVGSASGSAIITGNKLQPGTTTTQLVSAGTLVMDTPDYSVQADITLNSSTISGFKGIGVIARMSGPSSGVENRIVFGLFDIGGGLAWQVFWADQSGGGNSITTGVPVTPVSGTTYTIKLTVTGTAVVAQVNGSTVISGPVTTVTAAGRPGLYLFSNTPEMSVDNFSATETVTSLTAGTTTLSSKTDVTVNLSCTAATNGRPNYTYQWYRSTTSGFTPGSGNLLAGQTSLSLADTGLTASTTYYYVLRSTDSEQTPATADATQLAVTTNASSLTSGTITVNSTGSTTASLTASAASLGTSPYTYQWYRSTTSGFTPGVGNLLSGATSLSLNDTGLTASTTYYYVIRSVDSAGTPATVFSTQATAVTSSVSVVTVLPNDSNILYSPYNWTTGSAHAIATSPGAYAVYTFTAPTAGTAVLRMDTTGYPGSGTSVVVSYNVDGGAWTSASLTIATTSITLATGLSAGSHTITVSLDGQGTATDVWSSSTVPQRLDITSFELASGSSMSAATSGHTKRMLVFGDSITLGYGTTSARASWSKFLADALDADLGQIAYGGHGYANIGQGNVPPLFTVADATNTSWNLHRAGTSRLTGGLLLPTPDYIVINEGTNDTGYSDVAVSARVAGFLTAIRAAAPNAWVFVVAPFGRFKLAAITTGFTTYQTGAPDKKCVLIDAGTALSAGITGLTGVANATSIDGLHPNPGLYSSLGAAVATQIKNTLRAPAGMMGL